MRLAGQEQFTLWLYVDLTSNLLAGISTTRVEDVFLSSDLIKSEKTEVNLITKDIAGEKFALFKYKRSTVAL